MSYIVPSVPATKMLFGRSDLLTKLKVDYRNGSRCFGFEGVTGIGKSAVATALSEWIAKDENATIIRLDAAKLAGEPLFNASLYSQMRSARARNEPEGAEVCARILDQAPSFLRKLLGAAIADVVKAANENMENVAAVLNDAISGEEQPNSVSDEMLDLASANQRYFVTNYMEMLSALGCVVVIAIDNYEEAEPSVCEAVRHIVNTLPPPWTIIVSNNGEKPRQADWSNVLRPVIELKGGSVNSVEGLSEGAVTEWYTSVFGKVPSEGEVATLMEQSQGGRAQLIRDFLAFSKDQGAAPRAVGTETLHRARRLRYSTSGRAIAELLAPAKLDAVVPRDLLEQAALESGVSDFGAGLDELVSQGEFKLEGTNVGFYHSSYQQAWSDSISKGRKQSVASVWYDVLTRGGAEGLSHPEAMPLIHALTKLLVERHQPRDLLTLSNKLIGSGTQSEALAILDASWSPSLETKESGMLEHALLAAQTRIDLGRYNEAEESLSFAETAPDELIAIRAKLLRMKLSLRRNVYDAVWILSAMIEERLPERAEIQMEREFILNAALRDVLDIDRLKASVERLREYRKSAPAEIIGNLDRVLARSLVKLGDVPEALKSARSALTHALELHDLRAHANSLLALGEALRYQNDPEAISVYNKSAGLARAIGNRDGRIWALLGLAAFFLQSGDVESAQSNQCELRQLLTEPGFDHPLETAHLQFLQAIGDVLSNKQISLAVPTLAAYDRIGISWPKSFVVALLERGRLDSPIPL